MEKGRTQIAGFEEASVLLGRTKQACAFRWNKYIRPTQIQRKSSVDEKQITEISYSPSLQNHMQLAMESYNELKLSYDQISQEYSILKRDYELLVSWVKQGISHIE